VPPTGEVTAYPDGTGGTVRLDTSGRLVETNANGKLIVRANGPFYLPPTPEPVGVPMEPFGTLPSRPQRTSPNADMPSNVAPTTTVPSNVAPPDPNALYVPASRPIRVQSTTSRSQAPTFLDNDGRPVLNVGGEPVVLDIPAPRTTRVQPDPAIVDPNPRQRELAPTGQVLTPAPDIPRVEPEATVRQPELEAAAVTDDVVAPDEPPVVARDDLSEAVVTDPSSSARRFPVDAERLDGGYDVDAGEIDLVTREPRADDEWTFYDLDDLGEGGLRARQDYLSSIERALYDAPDDDPLIERVRQELDAIDDELVAAGYDENGEVFDGLRRDAPSFDVERLDGESPSKYQRRATAAKRKYDKTREATRTKRTARRSQEDAAVQAQITANLDPDMAPDGRTWDMSPQDQGAWEARAQAIDPERHASWQAQDRAITEPHMARERGEPTSQMAHARTMVSRYETASNAFPDAQLWDYNYQQYDEMGTVLDTPEAGPEFARTPHKSKKNPNGTGPPPEALVRYAVFGTDQQASSARAGLRTLGYTDANITELNGLQTRYRSARATTDGVDQTTLPDAPTPVPVDEPSVVVDTPDPIAGRRITYATDTLDATPDPVEQVIPAGTSRVLPDYYVAPIENVLTAMTQFQMRHVEFVEDKVQRIIANWDPKRVDALKVKANGDHTFTVLSGHNRREAMRRMIADGTIPNEVPMQVVSGTDSELRLIALGSNDSIALKPTEEGEKIALKMEVSGQSLDEVASGEIYGAAKAKRYYDLRSLPDDLKEQVDASRPRISVEKAAAIGRAIREGNLSSGEAQILFKKTVDGKFSEAMVDEFIVANARRRALEGAPTQQGGMFGADVDLGDTGMAETIERLETVLREIDKVTYDINTVTRTQKPSKSGIIDNKVTAQAKKDLMHLEARRVELRVQLDDLKNVSPPSGMAPIVIPQNLNEAAAISYVADAERIPYTPPAGSTNLFAVSPQTQRLLYIQAKFAEARLRARGQDLAAQAARIRTSTLGMPPGVGTDPIISDKSRDMLDQTFLSHETLRGRSYEQRLVEHLGGKALVDAGDDELADAFGKLERDLLIEKEVPEPGAIGRLLDRYSSGYSSHALMTWWSAPRTLISNYFLGNVMQLIIGGQGMAMKGLIDRRMIGEVWDLARRAEVPRAGRPAERSVAYGLGGVNAGVYERGVIGSAADDKTAKLLRRAAYPARPGFSQVFDGGMDAYAKLSGQKWTKEAANGIEFAFRSSAYDHNFVSTIPEMKANALTVFKERARTMMPGLGDEEIEATFRSLGKEFDQYQVREAFTKLGAQHSKNGAKANAFGDRLARDWINKVRFFSDEAVASTNKVLFPGASRNIDDFARRVIPFHMWMTRAIPFYIEQGLRNPALAATYFRAAQASQNQAEVEGWPDGLKGYLKMWTGPGGLALFFNPLSAAALLDTFVMDTGGYESEDATFLGTLLQDTGEKGFGLLPIWGAVLNYTGLLGDSTIGLDPIGTYGQRKFFGSAIQLAAAHGLLGEGNERYLGKPFEDGLQRIREYTTGVLGMQVDAEPQSAYGLQIINNVMLDAALEEHGMTLEQYLAYGSKEVGSPEHDRFVWINEYVLTERETEGPLYDTAVKQYSWSMELSAITAAVVQGRKPMRQTTRMEMDKYQEYIPGATPTGTKGQSDGASLLAPRPDPYADGAISVEEADFLLKWKGEFGVTYAAGDLERMRSGVGTARDLTEYTPEAARLRQTQHVVEGMGTEQDRSYLSTYYDIAFEGGNIGGNTTATTSAYIRVGGYVYRDADLARMSSDERGRVADAWLAENDPDGSVMKLKDEKKLYTEAHADYANFAAWRKGVFDTWGASGDAGLYQYAMELSRTNPNAKRHVDGLLGRARERAGANATPQEIQHYVAMEMTNVAMYMAVRGRSMRLDAPTTLSTGEGDALMPGAEATGAPGTGGATTGGGKKQSWDQQVETAFGDYNTWLIEVDALLSQQYGYKVYYATLPGPVRQAADASVEQAGLMPPEGAWIVSKYEEWADKRKRYGKDFSIAAFINETREDDETKHVPLPGEGSAQTQPDLAAVV